MRTIQLSVKQGKAYYLTSITEQQNDRLRTLRVVHKDPRELTKELDKLTIIWGINCDGIISIGETSKIRGVDLSDHIEKFAGKDTHETGMVGHNREVHYRNYRTTRKKQDEIKWLVNTCPDALMSVKSAVSIMDNKWSILWGVRTHLSPEKKDINPIYESMTKLLKDKVSCKVHY